MTALPGKARTAAVTLALLLSAVVACGCQTLPQTKVAATIAVDKSAMEPGEQVSHFEMTTDRAAYSSPADGWYRVLVRFPLPGGTIRAEHPPPPSTASPSEPTIANGQIWGPAVGKAIVTTGKKVAQASNPLSPAGYYLCLQVRSNKGNHVVSSASGEEAAFVDAGKAAGQVNRLWLAESGWINIRHSNEGRDVEGNFDLTCNDGLHLAGHFAAYYDQKIPEDFRRLYLERKPAGATTKPATNRPPPAAHPGVH